VLIYPAQRPLFWAQTPLALASGVAIFFSIPKSFVTGLQESNKETPKQKLASIDYLGAVTLASSPQTNRLLNFGIDDVT
jgi:hypothetical protein